MAGTRSAKVLRLEHKSQKEQPEVPGSGVQTVCASRTFFPSQRPRAPRVRTEAGKEPQMPLPAAWRIGTGRREELRGQADVATQGQCGLPELNKAINQRRPENTVMEELGHQPRAWAVGRAE